MGRSTTARVEAVDLARGIALVGMMLVHIGPYWIERNPPIGSIVAGGRAAPLFALLAGVALTIVHDRDPRGAGSTRATWIRAVLLIALGLWLGSLEDLPVLIILASYGLMIVLALPFRRLSTRVLLVLAAVWALAAPVALLGARIAHSPVQAGQAELSDLKAPHDLVSELVVWGAYPAGVWFAYVLAGLAIGRLDLRRTVVAWRLVAVGVALVSTTLGAGLFLINNGMAADSDGRGWRLLFASDYGLAQWEDLLLVGEHTSMPLNVLSATGSAVLVIGVCALLVRLPWARLILVPLRAAGAMTLTLYVIHVLWTWRLRVDFLDDPAAGIPKGSYQDWLLQVVVLCVVATLWQRFIGKGPLEWLMRRASVWGRSADPKRV
ncbi:heparan-alpha-glucosaminide N-acetyltransferase domain-containing protein [Aeromicrobium sp.]|uniref:heparan-alpha-glucosaminide N-acetyltransferase domain-containing protein n=1 Tax=Aeromicrobium sp. TaxID=1871063 RepID=UPI0030BCBE6F